MIPSRDEIASPDHGIAEELIRSPHLAPVQFGRRQKVEIDPHDITGPAGVLAGPHAIVMLEEP